MMFTHRVICYVSRAGASVSRNCNRGSSTHACWNLHSLLLTCHRHHWHLLECLCPAQTVRAQHHVIVQLPTRLLQLHHNPTLVTWPRAVRPSHHPEPVLTNASSSVPAIVPVIPTRCCRYLHASVRLAIRPRWWS